MLRKLKIKILFLLLIVMILVAILFVYIFQEPSAVYFSEQNVLVDVELARNPFQWSTGLKFCEYLPDNSGMLFIFPYEKIPGIWMKDVPIALDVIFISKDKQVVDVKENFQPCVTDDCEIYFPKLPAKYVLEVRAGFIQENNIILNSQIDFK